MFQFETGSCAWKLCRIPSFIFITCPRIISIIISPHDVLGGRSMHGTISKGAANARETSRSPVRLDEQLFGSCLADVARLLWPTKTAAHVASAVGCTERAAEFWLSGQREWSGDALAAIVGEICKRHGMRNARVKAK